jgi:hypothetical protein
MEGRLFIDTREYDVRIHFEQLAGVALRAQPLQLSHTLQPQPQEIFAHNTASIDLPQWRLFRRSWPGNTPIQMTNTRRLGDALNPGSHQKIMKTTILRILAIPRILPNASINPRSAGWIPINSTPITPLNSRIDLGGIATCLFISRIGSLAS